MKKQPQKKAPPPAAKKQPKKKEPPALKKKPPQKKAPAAAVLKQPQKKAPPPAAKKQPKKKEPPALKKKPPQKKAPAAAVRMQAEKRELAVDEKKQQKKKELAVVVLGSRYKCYKCGAKFYDLGKPQPLCPSCGANQNDDEAKGTSRKKKKRRSFSPGRSYHVITAPEERDDAIEVVNEVDAEYALDIDDIVLEGNEDTEKPE